MIQLLEAALRRSVSGEVRLDPGAKAAYAADASNYRQVPLAVVLPRSAEDIVAAVAACREHAAPVLARGLTFAPDPATHSRCTLGGMIGNNSCGPHSVMAGKTVENGELIRRRFPKIKHRVSGYNIDQVMHGHCHQKALWGTQADLAVLRDSEVLAPAP